MNVQAPFGFVTGCHSGDKFMVQATLASMRHYCPTIPICLVVDGIFDVADLQKEYDLIVLRVSELHSAEIRKLIGGNYRAKLAAHLKELGYAVSYTKKGEMRLDADSHAAHRGDSAVLGAEVGLQNQWAGRVRRGNEDQ